MQIWPIKNPNFEKPSRNLSNRTKVKILKKIFFLISLKKNLVPRMRSLRGNVRTSNFWRKSKEKKRNFFRKFTKGIYGFDLGQKKFKIISCLCTFKAFKILLITSDWTQLMATIQRIGKLVSTLSVEQIHVQGREGSKAVCLSFFAEHYFCVRFFPQLGFSRHIQLREILYYSSRM